MNREQIILENIDTCIENTKKFLKEHNKLVRNINKAINAFQKIGLKYKVI